MRTERVLEAMQQAEVIFGPVTLVRGTRGMGSLRPGTYVDEHTVTYRVEGTPEAQSRFRVIHEILRS